MEMRTVFILTERQEEVAEAVANLLVYLPPEDRRVATEAALAAVKAWED